MKIDSFVLIIACLAIAAYGLFVLWGVLYLSLTQPMGWIAAVLFAIAVFVIWRVVAERVGNAQEDHYDDMEH